MKKFLGLIWFYLGGKLVVDTVTTLAFFGFAWSGVLWIALGLVAVLFGAGLWNTEKEAVKPE